MQERYLGDSHDYAKFALLRHVGTRLDGQIGVNWYLTDPGFVDKVGNKDGEQRHHLPKRWAGWEGDILDELRKFASFSERRINQIPKLSILPSNTLYFEELVPTVDRLLWHQRAQNALAQASIVFLDPDNGLEVASMSRKRAPKYALYSEAADYCRDGKIVILIQFARQCDPVNKASVVREKLSNFAGLGGRGHMPVVRARMAPNVLFLFLAPPSSEAKLADAITSFSNGRDKIEIIP